MDTTTTISTLFKGPALALSSAPSLREAALGYAELGVPIFPCKPGGKEPLTAQGFRDATTNPTQVEAWWRRTPLANIGLPTGAASRLDVVDIDRHTDGDGFASFERAQTAGLARGWGIQVRTPSEGLHVYYPSTAGVEQRCWQAPRAHIDFRGDGGYIIAPPSRLTVEGREVSYRVIASALDRIDPVDAIMLRQFLEPPRSLPSRPPSASQAGGRPDHLAAWMASRPEGSRNRDLFWAACRMVEDGHSYHRTLDVLGEAASTAGLEETEIRSCIRSAYKTTSPLARPSSATVGHERGRGL